MAFGGKRAGVARAAFKERQEQVVRLLASHGLRRGPRPLSRVAGDGARGEGRARRLSRALGELGPVFSSFGLYLSTRADILAEDDRAELAATRSLSDAASPAAVVELFAREFGRGPAETFAAFEDAPFASSALFQTHRAWLPDGQPVTVRLLRPEAEARMRLDPELLPLVKVAFAGRPGEEAALDGAINDFRVALAQRADLLREAGALECLAAEACETGLLHVPAVCAPLCSRRVLTAERIEGVGLDELLRARREGAGEVSPPPGLPDPRALAHSLCRAWLRQFVRGSFFPVEVAPEDLIVMPGGRVALAGGLFASLPPESRASLWGYLVAAANEDPGRACSHLLQELRRAESPGREDLLQQRFKQVVPFRDGEWFDGDGLSERLLLHWRLTFDCGHLPGASMTSFYRGVYAAASLARRMAPGHDALLDALQEVRLIEGLERFREAIGPDQFGAQLGRYASAAVELPQRLDEALTLTAAGPPRLSLQVSETAAQRRRKNSSAAVTALLLALAAVALLTQRFASALPGGWAEKLGAVAFILVGVLLLRAAGRA